MYDILNHLCLAVDAESKTKFILEDKIGVWHLKYIPSQLPPPPPSFTSDSLQELEAPQHTHIHSHVTEPISRELEIHK